MLPCEEIRDIIRERVEKDIFKVFPKSGWDMSVSAIRITRERIII